MVIARTAFLLCFLTAFLQAQSVSDELKKRTGHTLRNSPNQGLPPGVSLVGGWITAQGAVAAALWNNTALQADLASLDVTRADLIEAGLFRNPSFSMLLPAGPKPFEFLLAWPIEELWQRKHRVKAAQANYDAVAISLVQNGLNLVRDVRLAHADLWTAQERTRTLRESADLRERIAALTDRRRDNGEGTGLDVNIARADALSVRELANHSASDIDVMRSRLRRLLGMPEGVQPLTAVPDPETAQTPTIGALLEMAMSNRPDLRAAELDIETTAQRAKWQRSRILAMLTPTLSSKEVGDFGLRSGPGLNAEIPALSRNRGQISKADAEVLRAGRVYASAKDRVEQEVVEAYERLRQAQDSLEQIRQQVLPPVNEAVRLTERAYLNGDVSLLNVLEANRQRYDIALRELEARAAAYRAIAELERAIGRSL